MQSVMQMFMARFASRDPCILQVWALPLRFKERPNCRVPHSLNGPYAATISAFNLSAV